MDLSDVRPDLTIDVRGDHCPMPILKTSKALKNMEAGQVLEVLGTDPGTKKDMPKVAEKSGNQWLGVLEDEGFYRFYLKKS